MKQQLPQEIQVYVSANEWPNVQNHERIIRKKPKKWIGRVDAAIIIQRAYRRYRKKKLLRLLNQEVRRKFRPNVPPKKPKKGKVLEMFTPSKNSVAKVHMNEISCTALSPTRKPLLSETSLFQKDRETVLVFGGIDPHNNYGVGRNTGKNIFRYVPDGNKWEYVGELPEPRHHHCTQFFKGRVYLVGGADPRENEIRGKSAIVETMWSFDPVSRCWFSEPALLEPRKNFGLVACNHSLYAMGGQGKHYDALRSLEKYNIEDRQWEEKAPMIHARTGLACAKYRSYIWVAGGLSGTSKKRVLMDSVESYNLKSDQWTEIEYPLRFPRCFSCMFVMSDHLYVIGGAGSTSESDKHTTSVGDIDVWDPDNIEWRNVTEMHIPRHGHSVAYLGTQILVTGGVTTIYRRALSSVECFCSQRGVWVRGLACLPIGLSGHAAVTLPPASLLAY